MIVGVTSALRLALRATGPVHDFRAYNGVASLIGPVTVAMLFVVAAFRTGIHRWRWYFVFCSVLNVVAFSLKGIGVTHLTDLVSYLATASILIGVVSTDVARGQKHVWTHWIGVALWPWFAILLLGWLLYQVFLIELGFDATSHAT